MKLASKSDLKFPSLNTAVRVHWLDSTSEPGWHYLQEGQALKVQPRRLISLGYLKALSASSITLAHSVAPMDSMDLNEGLMDPLSIPVGCITELQVIP